MIRTLSEKLFAKPFLFSFLLVSLVFAVTLCWIEPVFQTNDDSVLMLILSGKILSNVCHPNLVYMHYYTGLLISSLYERLPDIPWYGIFMVFVNYVSCVFILYSILSYRRTVLRVCWFLVFFFIIELYFIQLIQFSATAVMAAASGYFLFLTALEQKRKREIFGFAILTLIMFTLAIFVRAESMLVTAPVMFPVIAIRMIEKRSRIKTFLSMAMLATLVIITGFSVMTSVTESWRGTVKTNNTIGQIWDYGKVKLDSNDPETQAAIGKPAINYEMFRNRFMIDTSVYHISMICALINKKLVHNPMKDGRDFSLKTVLNDFSFLRNKIMLLMALFFIFVNVFIEKAPKWNILIGSVSVISTFVLFCFLQKYFKLPLYFFMPLLSLPVLIGIYFSEEKKINTVPFMKTGAILVTLGIAILYSRHCYTQDSRPMCANIEKSKRLFSFLRANPGNVYFMTRAFPLEEIPVLRKTDFLDSIKGVSIEGLLSFSEYTYNRLREERIANPVLALAKNEHAALIADESFVADFKKFVKGNYELDITEEVLYTYSASCSVYRFQVEKQ